MVQLVEDQEKPPVEENIMESYENLQAFLLEVTAKQRQRVERLTEFLTQAEEKLLSVYDLDNIPIPELAKKVSELHRVLYDFLELARRMAAGSNPLAGSSPRIPFPTGADEEIEEIAYLLRGLEPEQFKKLKKGIMKIKPQLRLIRRGKASPKGLDEPSK